MSLSSQLLLGNIANIAGFVFGILLIVISLPMLIWLIVSIVRWVKGSHIIFKWWGVTAVTLCGLGLIIYCFARIFGGASYTIASKVDIHVPMSVRVLENGSYVAIDGSESYTVVQLSETQMNTFINSAKKDWRFGTVVPYSPVPFILPLMKSNFRKGKTTRDKLVWWLHKKRSEISRKNGDPQK